MVLWKCCCVLLDVQDRIATAEARASLAQTAARDRVVAAEAAAERANKRATDAEVAAEEKVCY